MVQSRQEQQDSSAFIFEAVMGTPVQWPSDFDQAVSRRPIEELLSRRIVQVALDASDAECDEEEAVDEVEGDVGGDGSDAESTAAADDACKAADQIALQIQHARSVDELTQIVGAAKSGRPFQPAALVAESAQTAAAARAAPSAGEARCSGEVGEDACEPIAKKGRKSLFALEQKQWILDKHTVLFGAACVAPMSFMKDIADEGIASGALPPAATAEKIRQVVRDSLRP